jgi:hypothetical protein
MSVSAPLTTGIHDAESASGRLRSLATGVTGDIAVANFEKSENTTGAGGVPAQRMRHACNNTVQGEVTGTFFDGRVVTVDGDVGRK